MSYLYPRLRESLRLLSVGLILVLMTVVARAAAPAAPTGLSIAMTKGASSHTYVALWTDNSTNETGFEVDVRVGTSGGFTVIQTASANASGVAFVLTSPLTAGTTLQYQVRAVNGSGSSLASNQVTFVIPVDAFAPPTGVTVTPASETVLSASWTDASTTEDGEEVELSSDGGTTYTKLADILFYQQNSISISALQPGTVQKVRLRAYKEGTPRSYTAYSSVATTTTPFNAPSGLSATANGENTVNLIWADNSTTEGGYAVYYKLSTDSAYTFFNYTAANATSASVTGLQPGSAYNFQVAAAYQSTSIIESSRSNTASATTKDGFTSAPFITFGANNSYTNYQATTSSPGTRTWNAATGLPTGMSFNAGTGIISGTPTQFGLFTATLSASFTGGWTSTLPVKIRVVRSPAAPTVAVALPATQSFTNGGAAATISLSDKFADLDTESAVRLVTTKGNIDVLLYPTETPSTVTNFLGYVNRGDYDNSAFHRISTLADSGVAVLQGGQIKPAAAGPTTFTAIIPQAAIQNEAGISNLNYTIAMAKQGGNTNSATKEFYFNLTDVNTVLDPVTQNGGFTVFGRVSAATKANLDAISSAPMGGPYNTLVDSVATNTGFKWPMNVASTNDLPATMDNTKIMKIISVAPISNLLTYSASSSAPGVASATLSGSNLIITPVGPGATTVTASATDLDGQVTSQTISVTVNQAPAFTSAVPTSTGLINTAYNFTCSASGYPAPTFSVPANTLPTGLTLNPTSGAITGTPTATGIFTGTITASNGIGTAATQNFSITINQTPAFTSSAPTSTGKVGTAYNFSCAATGFPAPAFSVTPGTLPTGLSLSSAGAITGTPTTSGVFTGIITASNGIGTAATQNVTITISQAVANWAASQGLSGANAQPDADPDHDGLTNLQEFAFMTNPNAGSSNTAPSFATTAGATKYGEITFPVRKFTSGLTYYVEASNTLVSNSWTTILWTSTDGFSAANVSAYTDMTDRTVVTIRDTVASPPATRRFLRVRVSSP